MAKAITVPFISDGTKISDTGISKIYNVKVSFVLWFQDIFTTLVDTQWRWTILVFALSFLSSWFGFGCIWWLIAYTHGDLEPENLKPDADWSPCVDNINSFASCFLFSLETQHTIGYGGRATTEECPEAIIAMCMQSIWGMMIQVSKQNIYFLHFFSNLKYLESLINVCDFVLHSSFFYALFHLFQ